MPSKQLSELIPVLQTAIGPVILISGVGLLLLTLANRFGRAVDRVRQLLREMRTASGESRSRLARQVANLYERAQLIQRAIVFSAISILFAALLIIALFFTALMHLDMAVLISVLFICCLVSLIVSLIAFTMDIRLSLVALKVEMGEDDSDSVE